MVFRAMTRFALALLIAVLQGFVGGGVSNPSQGASAATYSCCCVGECHCTGDCCNHGPVSTGRSQKAPVRVGADTPVLQAPTQCGIWQGTLQRAPEQSKALLTDSRGKALVTPNRPRMRLSLRTVIRSLENCLRPSSPRAPPAHAAHA